MLPLPPEPNPNTSIPCPHCGEPIDPAGLAFIQAPLKLGPDPLKQFLKAMQFDGEQPSTVQFERTEKIRKARLHRNGLTVASVR